MFTVHRICQPVFREASDYGGRAQSLSFCCLHELQLLPTTHDAEGDAKAVGVADHTWSMEELVELIEERQRMKEETAFDAAFAERYKAPRVTPKTFTPRQPDLSLVS